MEQIQILTEDKFKEIYLNERLRNDTAYAVGCYDSNNQFLYKKAVSFPVSYIVTDKQILICKDLIEKKKDEVLKENKNNLLFCGMGMEFKPNIQDGVGNHRIRTEFLNKDGVKCFIEVGTSCKSDNLRVDCAIYDYGTKDKNGYDNYKYNYKELETKTPALKYTYENVLNLVNKYFNCNFKKMVVDYYNISCDGILCISPKL